MRQRQDGGRPADAGPAAVVVAVVPALAGCSTGSQPPVSIGPGPGGAEGCVFERGTQVCATGTPSGTPTGPAASGPASAP